MKKISYRITVSGGSLLSAANAEKIVARSTKPTDRSGNSLPTPIDRHKDDPPYFQVWRIKKEQAGFIFREVTHNGGISGHHHTIRALVISALCVHGSGIVVEVDA